MNPAHHPAEERLNSYALGRLDSSFRLVIETHLALCEACRVRVSDAAAQLVDPVQNVPAQPLPEGSLSSLLKKVRALPALAAPMCGRETLPLPVTTWPLLPDLGSLRWQGALSPGFRFLRLPSAPSSADLFLLHLRKGCPFPRHGHLGVEQSMILCGGLQDEFGILGAGDYEESSTDKIHRPMALPDEDCWLISSVEGGVHFSGWRGWFQA